MLGVWDRSISSTYKINVSYIDPGYPWALCAELMSSHIALMTPWAPATPGSIRPKHPPSPGLIKIYILRSGVGGWVTATQNAAQTDGSAGLRASSVILVGSRALSSSPSSARRVRPDVVNGALSVGNDVVRPSLGIGSAPKLPQ